MNQPLTSFLIGLLALGLVVSPGEALAQPETKAATAPTETKEPAPAAATTKEAAGKEDPAHGELRKVRDGLVKAVEARDIDGVLSFLDPNVVVVWQNGETSRGHEGVRAYYNR